MREHTETEFEKRRRSSCPLSSGPSGKSQTRLGRRYTPCVSTEARCFSRVLNGTRRGGSGNSSHSQRPPRLGLLESVSFLHFELFPRRRRLRLALRRLCGWRTAAAQMSSPERGRAQGRTARSSPGGARQGTRVHREARRRAGKALYLRLRLRRKVTRAPRRAFHLAFGEDPPLV